MAHQHSHDHAGHHYGPAVLTSINRALIVGAGLNVVYVTPEFGRGFYYYSLALTADAGHNLSDMASLLLSLLAFRLSRVRQTPGWQFNLHLLLLFIYQNDLFPPIFATPHSSERPFASPQCDG